MVWGRGGLCGFGLIKVEETPQRAIFEYVANIFFAPYRNNGIELNLVTT